MRVTRPNLLSWYDSAADPSALPLPSPNDCRIGALVACEGEAYRFYLNLKTPFTASPTPVITMNRVKVGASDLGTASTFSVDSLGTGQGYQVYGTLLVPGLLTPGLYQWKITAGGTVLVSNPIQVMTPADARKYSILCEYRHTRSVHGIRYPWLSDQSFTQSARVRCTLIDTPYPTEATNYREASTGHIVPYATSQDSVLTFQTTYVDKDLIEGLAVMLAHDTLSINSKPCTGRDYPTPARGRGNLSTVTFGVYDQSFSQALLP